MIIIKLDLYCISNPILFPACLFSNYISLHLNHEQSLKVGYIEKNWTYLHIHSTLQTESHWKTQLPAQIIAEAGKMPNHFSAQLWSLANVLFHIVRIYIRKRQLSVIKEVWGKSPLDKSLKIINNKPLSSQWHKAESWIIYPKGQRGKRDGNVIKSRSWNRGRERTPLYLFQ